MAGTPFRAQEIRRSAWVLGLAVCITVLALGLRDASPPSWPIAASSESIGSRPPVTFAPNEGQFANLGRFYARGAGYAFGFGARRATFTFERGQRGHVLGLRFVGANPNPAIEGRRRAGTVSHFSGTHRGQSAAMYREIVYRDLWPGIDMVFTGGHERLKYSFVVQPGARVSDIQLAYEGARGVSLNSAGDLLVRTSLGVARDPRPSSHQTIDGSRTAVASAFASSGFAHGIEVGRYDRSRPLVIDPALEYGTFVGGPGLDEATAIAIDDAGSAYVTGTTYNGAFPTTPGAYNVSNVRRDAVFVTKLDPDGTDLIYSALIGGSSSFHARGQGIAVDEEGAAYVTGSTDQTDFPTTPGAFADSADGIGSFVLKLSRDGSRLEYSTFLGDRGPDAAADVAVDADGNAYVTGSTYSSTFPTTPGALDREATSLPDAFVTKLNPTGSALVYSTYLGGSGGENNDFFVGNIEVDPDRNAYVTGTTTSPDFPTTDGAHDRTANGTFDAFVIKLNPAGSGIVSGTLFGGSSFDYPVGLAVDTGGNAYIAGQTNSTDMPATGGAFDTTANGGRDAFVAKFSSVGFGLSYATYLGGSELDNFPVYGDVAVDRGGRAYAVGYESSPNFPLTSDAVSTSQTFGFLTKLRADGSGLLFSTLGLGYGAGVAVDGSGNAYVAGLTYTGDILTTPDAYDTTLNPSEEQFRPAQDAFAIKIDTSRDVDGDGTSDDEDNCPDAPNADQHDADADGIGDTCDPEPGSTPCAVEAHGRLVGDSKAKLTVDAAFVAGDAAPAGDVSYHDLRARLKPSSRSITSLIAYGRHSVLLGTAKIKRDHVTFRLELDARAGANPAHVKLTLSNGYAVDSDFNGHIWIDCPG